METGLKGEATLQEETQEETGFKVFWKSNAFIENVEHFIT